MKGFTLTAFVLLAFPILSGCHKGPYDGMDSKLRADYQKAAEDNAAFQKLPPEQQIESIKNNKNMPEMYKQSFIAKIKAKNGLK